MDESTPPRAPAILAADAGGASARRDPRTVDAGHGTAWWGAGWRLFAAAPGVWLLMTVALVVIMVMLSFVPILGSVASTVLGPVFAGGVLMGFRAQDRGGQPALAHLFAGFNERLVPLLVVGLLYLAGTFVIMLCVLCVLFLALGASGIGALLSGDAMTAGFAMLATFGVGAMAAVLVGLLLGVPLMMAYWFAPALVVLRNDEPVAAMKASFSACLGNMLSMLVYSLLGLVLAIAASLPLLLGWLVLAPVFAGSIYASYKDIFE